MERLTKKGYNFSENDIYSSIDSWSLAQCLNRLREYEDTGLEPEEIVKLNNFTDNQAAKLLEKYQTEVEKHKWIPVDERLPEGEKEVLVTTNTGRITFGYLGDGELYVDLDLDYPIARMPLPEPYKVN